MYCHTIQNELEIVVMNWFL